LSEFWVFSVLHNTSVVYWMAVGGTYILEFSVSHSSMYKVHYHNQSFYSMRPVFAYKRVSDVFMLFSAIIVMNGDTSFLSSNRGRLFFHSHAQIYIIWFLITTDFYFQISNHFKLLTILIVHEIHCIFNLVQYKSPFKLNTSMAVFCASTNSYNYDTIFVFSLNTKYLKKTCNIFEILNHL